jgi:gliotoxin biosynthesis cytochrome P450 monooxygenase
MKIYSGKFTTAGAETPALMKTIAIDLTRGIPAKVHSRQEDCKQVIDDTIGYCVEWKEFEIFSVLLRIVAQMNACQLVGRELGTNPKWVKLAERYPMAVMVGAFSMSIFPLWLQPLLAPILFAPTLKLKWDMKRMLAPVIKADMEEYWNCNDKKELLRSKPGGKVPFTAWLMSRYSQEQATVDQLMTDYVIATFESTPSTAGTTYNVLAELAAQPALMDDLRKELDEVMKDGKLPETHLSELRKMDSVMREATRTNPFSLCEFSCGLERKLLLMRR